MSSDRIDIEVRFFAGARDRVQRETVTLTLPRGATIADLRARLMQDYPKLTSFLQHCCFAVGDEYAAEDAALTSGAEVAVIPPVSGG